LDSGADTNAPPADRYYARERERTTLQDAAQRNNTELIKILLRAHADINAPATGEYGRTALQAAAQNETPTLFEFYWMQVQMPMCRLDHNAE